MKVEDSEHLHQLRTHLAQLCQQQSLRYALCAPLLSLLTLHIDLNLLGARRLPDSLAPSPYLSDTPPSTC